MRGGKTQRTKPCGTRRGNRANLVASVCLSVVLLHKVQTRDLSWKCFSFRRSPASARSKGVGLRPLVCWDCGIESHRGHGCRECCVLSGRGLCDELITHPEESYRLWCVVVCDLETSWMRRPWPTGGSCAINKSFLSPSLELLIRNVCGENGIIIIIIVHFPHVTAVQPVLTTAPGLTHQALLILCSAKNLPTVRRVLSVDVLCVRMDRARRTVNLATA